MFHPSRRKFIKHSSLASAGALSLNLNSIKALANFSHTKSLPYPSFQSHVLNRTSFGINQESKEKFNELGYIDYIDYQLNPDVIDDSEIEGYITDNLPTINMPVAEIRSMINDAEINQFRVADELVMATYLRAIYSKKQLFQVMVEFWNNHFSVYHLDGPISVLKSQEDREVIRPNALATFSELLHADAKSAAMIYYLDTYASSKEAPNENYARELMELHTLGVDGPYNHHDIDEVARCFTGWRINQANGNFRFINAFHDNDEKIVLGHIINAGGGVSDGEQVLDILASHPSTAAFISNKLCQHFIADIPDKSIIKSTTEVFIESNGDIKQTLRHLLLSKNFMTSVDQKLKRPFHYLASVTRSLNGDVKQQRAIRSTRLMFEALGQRPFAWQAPDGYPDLAGHWQSTSGMLFRWNFTNTFCFEEFPGYTYELDELIQQPHTPVNIIVQINNKVLHRLMSPADESALLGYLNDEIINNTVPTIKIQGALAIAMGSPYFQQC